MNWISVKDRFPEESGDFFTTCIYKYSYDINQRKFEFGKFWTGGFAANTVMEDTSVTHWMPLPEKPKE